MITTSRIHKHAEEQDNNRYAGFHDIDVDLIIRHANIRLSEILRKALEGVNDTTEN